MIAEIMNITDITAGITESIQNAPNLFPLEASFIAFLLFILDKSAALKKSSRLSVYFHIIIT